MIRILLIGGGSGGHAFPLIAVAEALKQKASQNGMDLELMVIGDGEFMANAAAEHSLVFKPIVTGKLRRYFSLLNFLDIFKIPIGFLQSLWYIFLFMPDVVFTKGGGSSIAPALVSSLYFIPIFTHESDSTPGLANKILSKFAQKIFISFPSSEKYFKPGKTILVGNPVRTNILTGNREMAMQTFGLDPARKTILVLGGSQGAQRINKIILDTLVLLTKDFQIIHQCGQLPFATVKAEADKIIKEGAGEYADFVQKNYKLYGFFSEKEIAQAYAVSDIVISRAGAGNVFEIAMVGKPTILIPLPTGSSRGDQIINASELAKFGAVVIEEENLTSHIIISQIHSLLVPEKYNLISEKLKTFATPDAAEKIASVLLGVQS